MYLHEKSEDDSQVGKLEEIIAEHDLCMNLNYMPHLTVSQNSFCASPEVAWHGSRDKKRRFEINFT